MIFFQKVKRSAESCAGSWFRGSESLKLVVNLRFFQFWLASMIVRTCHNQEYSWNWRIWGVCLYSNFLQIYASYFMHLNTSGTWKWWNWWWNFDFFNFGQQSCMLGPATTRNIPEIGEFRVFACTQISYSFVSLFFKKSLRMRSKLPMIRKCARAYSWAREWDRGYQIRLSTE